MSILQARQAGSGQVVTVTGVVTSGPELGTIRYIQDSTAGIAVYSTLVSNWVQGDSVMITGKLTEYFGLLEIAAPITLDTVLKQNTIPPSSKRIHIADMGEALEGQLVTLKKVFFRSGGSQIAAGSSYVISNGTDSTSAYFRNGSPLAGVTLPSDTVDITGICSQFTQYQILLRSDDAWIPYEPDPIAATAIVDLRKAIKLFPNPVTSDFLSVELPAGTGWKAEIRDATGRVQKIDEQIWSESGFLLNLVVPDLPKGFYQITISNCNKFYFSKFLHL